jgi:hypothetical protein
MLNACTAHLGVPIARYRVADWEGGNLEANCSKGLVRWRNSVQMGASADPASRPQENALEGIQLDVVGHKQHSGRASGPKSPP